MDSNRPKTIFYKRSNFVTHLPETHLYSRSHYWVSTTSNGLCRIGLTKFATRMLGDMVDHGFDIEPGATVNLGQVVGWLEGFKAISDIFSIAEGVFSGINPALSGNLALIGEDPYHTGWLFEVKGRPDAGCTDVQGYRAILDKTIDKLLEKQQAEG